HGVPATDLSSRHSARLDASHPALRRRRRRASPPRQERAPMVRAAAIASTLSESRPLAVAAAGDDSEEAAANRPSKEEERSPSHSRVIRGTGAPRTTTVSRVRLLTTRYYCGMAERCPCPSVASASTPKGPGRSYPGDTVISGRERAAAKRRFASATREAGSGPLRAASMLIVSAATALRIGSSSRKGSQIIQRSPAPRAPARSPRASALSRDHATLEHTVGCLSPLRRPPRRGTGRRRYGSSR